jgi:hypothetical protein
MVAFCSAKVAYLAGLDFFGAERPETHAAFDGAKGDNHNAMNRDSSGEGGGTSGRRLGVFNQRPPSFIHISI